MAPSATGSGYRGLTNRVGREMEQFGVALGEFAPTND